MAKKAARKQTRAPVAQAPTAPEGSDDHSRLKAEGDRAFAKKDYNKALAAYEAAIKAAGSPTSVADLRVARAGCYLLLPSKLKEARSECDAALEASPGNVAALARRARANEGLGMFKAALGDVQKALKGGASGSVELREQEARLKDVVSGKRPASSLMANGAAASAAAASARAGAPSVPRGLGGGLPAANGGRAGGADPAAQRERQQKLAQAIAAAQSAQQRQREAAANHIANHLSARITLPGDRGSGELVSVSAGASLADLVDGVRRKFHKELGIPESDLDKPGGVVGEKGTRVKISWLDPPGGGGPVVLRDASDVARAAASYRARAGVKADASSLAEDPEPLKFDVSLDDDAPVLPREEIDANEANRLRAAARYRELQKVLAEARAAEDAEAKGASSEQQLPLEAVVDSWVLDFAGLFRDKLGVDADAPVDLASHGWDALQAALDETVADDAAVPLLEKAADRFSESAVSSMLQWGNVHLNLARRALVRGFYGCDAAKGTDERAKKQARDAAAKEADSHFKAAQSKYNEAEKVRPGYHETHFSFANLEFERAKVAAGLVAPPARRLDEGEGGDDSAEATAARDRAFADATNSALHAAMKASLTSSSVRNAEGNMKRAWQSFEKAEAAVPAEERGKKQPQPPADGSPSAEEAGPWAHVMVMWGNALYEASQMHATVSLGNEKAWRPLLDSAVSKFRDAGCPEADITAALRAHVAADKLDLPPVDGEGKGDGEGDVKMEEAEASSA